MFFFKTVNVASKDAYVIDTIIYLTRLHKTFNFNRLKLLKQPTAYLKYLYILPGKANYIIRKVLCVIDL